MIRCVLCPDHSTVEAELLSVSELLDLENQIRNLILSSVFKLKSNDFIKLYIQSCHQRFIKLSNDLYSCQIQNCDTINSCLNSLVEYLIENFKSFLDPHQSVPEILKQKAIEEFCVKLSIIKHQFEPGELLSIALKPLDDFVENRNSISSHKLAYFQQFVDQLLSIENRLDGEVLKKKLYYLNFNSLSFSHYITESIHNEMDDMECISDKLNWLSWYLKCYRQAPVLDNAFCLNTKSINELVCSFLSEEISYLERSVHFKVKAVSANSATEELFKFITSLSVAQFAFLIRIFVDIGLFQNKNIRALASFIAQHSKTKSGVNISASSFLAKFYNHEKNAVEAVKGEVIKMLNKIQMYC